MSLPVPTTSALITRGVTTNRVRVRTPRKPRAVREPKHYHPDRKVRGLSYTTICISLPRQTLAEIDAARAPLKLSRSQFLRDAAIAATPPRVITARSP